MVCAGLYASFNGSALNSVLQDYITCLHFLPLYIFMASSELNDINQTVNRYQVIAETMFFPPCGTHNKRISETNFYLVFLTVVYPIFNIHVHLLHTYTASDVNE
jgi:hypothetical protein